MNIVDKDTTKDKDEQETVFYKEAFDACDWNHNGTIPTRVGRNIRISSASTSLHLSVQPKIESIHHTKTHQRLLYLMQFDIQLYFKDTLRFMPKEINAEEHRQPHAKPQLLSGW